MIPRGTPDIGWSDLGAALLGACRPGDPCASQRRIEHGWSGSRDTLVCLSVRSGFDLLLQAAAWPPGSEVLVSAVTIPDMIRLLEIHGLTPIPLDLDPATLSVDLGQLRRAISPRTRAILVAHLFGSHMPVEPLLAIARQHGLFVIEDCAQAYDGVFRGAPGSDARLWSFGPIKTFTALGGGIVQLNDPALLQRMRCLQERYPRQSRRLFLRRVVLVAALKLLARPRRLALFVALCRLRKQDYDRLLYRALRGFAGPNLLARLRQQPSLPLLHLLARRISRADPARVAARARAARRLLEHIPASSRIGSHANDHSHWMLPIISSNPATLVRVLQAQGFDATRIASSLFCVAAASSRPDLDPEHTRRWLSQIVYLPTYRPLPEPLLERLGRIVRDVERC
jgi:perosamine synthetase